MLPYKRQLNSYVRFAFVSLLWALGIFEGGIADASSSGSATLQVPQSQRCDEQSRDTALPFDCPVANGVVSLSHQANCFFIERRRPRTGTPQCELSKKRVVINGDAKELDHETGRGQRLDLDFSAGLFQLVQGESAILAEPLVKPVSTSSILYSAPHIPFQELAAALHDQPVGNSTEGQKSP